MEAVLFNSLHQNITVPNEESVAKVVISQADWDKINAAISEAVETAVSPLRARSPWHRPMDFLRRWSAIAILWSVPLGLIAFAGSAMYVAVARVDKQARFEEDTTNALKEINAHLKQIDTSEATARLEHAASSPTDKSSAAEVRAALGLAQKNSIQLSPDFIQKTGSAFINVADRNPSAWRAALDFVQYKTFANSLTVTIPGSSGNKPFRTMIHFTTPVGMNDPQITVAGIVPISSSAHFDYIGQTFNESPTKGTGVIFATGGGIVLDNMDIEGTVFRKVHIVYGGGPLILKNVYFIDCTFDMPEKANSRGFATAVLSSPSVSFSGE